MNQQTKFVNYDTLFSKSQNGNTIVFDQKYHQIQNVKQIQFISLEMPIFFSNIRNANRSTLFVFVFNNLSYSISIEENHYYSINQLLVALNRSIATSLGTLLTLVISVDPSFENKLVATTNATSLSFRESILANSILGISTSDSLSGNKLFFSRIYNLNPDSHIYFHINEIPSRLNNNSTIKGTFKLALLNSYAQYLFINTKQTYQSVSELPVNDTLSILLLDRFGFEIPVTNSFSFSLEYSS